MSGGTTCDPLVLMQLEEDQERAQGVGLHCMHTVAGDVIVPRPKSSVAIVEMRFAVPCATTMAVCRSYCLFIIWRSPNNMSRAVRSAFPSNMKSNQAFHTCTQATTENLQKPLFFLVFLHAPPKGGPD